MSDFRIHPEAHPGPVHLVVSDLARLLRFYQEVIGLDLIEQRSDTAVLGVGRASPLLLLTREPGAPPRPPRTTGLYHFAIRLPDRVELARTLQHLDAARYPLQGSADHLVSEALYLADPEHNGIEIYADRPRDAWPHRDGQVQMATDWLDHQDLLAELERDPRPWEGMAPGTRIGHVHLQVADLRQAEAFYHGVLGFDLTLRYGDSALFFSAGGYHHHVGVNTWAGSEALSPPAGAAGLCYFTVLLPDQAAWLRVRDHLRASGAAFDRADDVLVLRDPAQNGVRLLVDDGPHVIQALLAHMA